MWRQAEWAFTRCVGRVCYRRASTGDFRVAFESVPAWETARRLYWPAGDPDMQPLLGPDRAPVGLPLLSLSQSLSLSLSLSLSPPLSPIGLSRISRMQVT